MNPPQISKAAAARKSSLKVPSHKEAPAKAVRRFGQNLNTDTPRCGWQIISFIEEYGHPVAVAIILVLMATAAVIFYFWRGRTAKGGHEKPL